MPHNLPRNVLAACVALTCLLLARVPTANAELSASETLATELIRRASVHRGVCAVLGGDPSLALKLAQQSELFVHARVGEPDAATELRSLAAEAGLGIDRLAAEQGGSGRLPYADNLVDVVVAASSEVTPDEVLRVLRPEGTALIRAGDRDNLQELKEWSTSAGVQNREAFQDGEEIWAQFTKPPLAGAGDWSHWEHGPDNNPVSEDVVIQAPYMTQFMAEPFYIAMPSITTAAGGRTFLAIGHIAHHRREWDMMQKLIARNGYNGTVLWERKLPDHYMVHRSAFIATKDTFYMLSDDHCLLLDPQTGEEKGEIRIPLVDGQWKWMVMHEGVLYVLAGKKDPGAQITKGDRTFGGWSWADLSQGYYQKPHVPWGFGNALAAYDVKEDRVLWVHTEDKPIDSRALALGEGHVYLYCPEQHLRCLEAASGDVVWTNDQEEVRKLIEQLGEGLTSTPGFRSAALAVLTPDALIIQGQTRMNVVAISTESGSLLWTKTKVTNNPNAIFVDGHVVMGVGPGGSHVVVDPISGNVLEDLNFRKRACTRLTACSDSFFVRGEGTLRFDRKSKKVLVDGAIRPACNDGALPANGLLYLGPWQCDCNLSLIGNVAKCSAGDFRFDHLATREQRLQAGQGDPLRVEPLDAGAEDWPTFRGNHHRSGSTAANVARNARQKWQYVPDAAYVPTPPVAAGGWVFFAGHDGVVRAVSGTTGELKWQYRTPSPIRMAPTIAEGRVFFGSGDGHVYALEATSGRLLWRFRAAPLERHIMLYGTINSTWPVNSGVLVADGVAYFAAGIIDYDGTYVYALDAKTGDILWQNNASGHLNAELRKGVSVQGNLTIQGDRLLLAGGNQISPAPFALATGECLAEPREGGHPQANHGQYVGVFADQHPLVGGRILFSAAENVATKGSFTVLSGGRNRLTLSYGGIPPAWDDTTFALVNYKHGKLTCCDAQQVAQRIASGARRSPQASDRGRTTLADDFRADGAVRWESDLGESNKFEAVALAVCPNAIVAAVQFQQKFRAQPQWQAVAFDPNTGDTEWRQGLDGAPLPGGLLVDRDGQVVLTLLDGRVICLGQ